MFAVRYELHLQITCVLVTWTCACRGYMCFRKSYEVQKLKIAFRAVHIVKTRGGWVGGGGGTVEV